MVRHPKFLFVVFLLFSFDCFGKRLEEFQLREFNLLLLKETKQSPENIFKYLSEDLAVETNIGSSAQGLKLFYNKVEYIKLITKHLDNIKEANKNQEINSFDFKVISSTKGEFTVKSYSTVTRSTVWSTFTVLLVKGKIQIIKIVDAV